MTGMPTEDAESDGNFEVPRGTLAQSRSQIQEVLEAHRSVSRRREDFADPPPEWVLLRASSDATFIIAKEKNHFLGFQSIV